MTYLSVSKPKNQLINEMTNLVSSLNKLAYTGKDCLFRDTYDLKKVLKMSVISPRMIQGNNELGFRR